VLFKSGNLMLRADSWMRQCYAVVCAWMADYFEIIHQHSIEQPHWPVRPALKSSFGERNSLSLQLRDFLLYFQNIILTM
jgi:hypothetical protein